MRRTIGGLAGCVVLAMATLAHAQTTTTTTTTTSVDSQAAQLDSTASNRGQTQVATQIASNFNTLAGSSDNSLALANALRTGTEVTLTTAATTPGGTSTTTTFTPPTGKMGWRNVFISMALAQDTLTRFGITAPTNAQLMTALMGGTLTKPDGTTVEVKGILQMRADGMGWGKIAQALGTKLGPVVSSIKSTQVKVGKLPKSETTTTAAAASTAPKSAATNAAGSSKVTTAGGAASANGAGRGLVTAGGASTGGGVSTPTSSHGQGNAYGRGIVTGTGSTVGPANVSPATGHGQGQGQGLVTGAGGSAGSITNAGGQGQGQGGDHGKGKGKGGG